MQKIALLSGVILSALLAACGGGGSDDNSASANTSPGVTATPTPTSAPTPTPSPSPTPTPSTDATYTRIVPTLGSQNTYAKTMHDNRGNTISYSYKVTVSAVGTDGSGIQSFASLPGGVNLILNGYDRTQYPESDDIDSAGRTLQYRYTGASGMETACSWNPHGGGAPATMKVGASFHTDADRTCTTNGVTYVDHFVEDATLTRVESITVPAGTFQAFRFDYVVHWNSNETDTGTFWRQASPTSTRLLRETFTSSYTNPGYGWLSDVDRVLIN